MFGIMGMSAAFMNAACAHKQKGNELRFICSQADPIIYQLSCTGDITIESTKNGAPVTATYSDLSVTQVSIQADADTEIVITGNVTRFGPFVNAEPGFGSHTVKSIDTKKCLSLKELDLNHSEITQLDLSNNIALEGIDIHSTNVSVLDLSTNTALTYLDVSGCTGLTILDLSTNTALTYLDVSTCTGLTTLDLSANTALVEFDCSSTEITSLDLSANTALESLYCSNAGITALNLSANTALETLYCYNTGITSLDLSTNTALDDFDCSDCYGFTEIKYPATNSDVSTAVADAIINATAADGTVYTDSAGAYYSTIAEAATERGWTIESL